MAGFFSVIVDFLMANIMILALIIIFIAGFCYMVGWTHSAVFFGVIGGGLALFSGYMMVKATK